MGCGEGETYLSLSLPLARRCSPQIGAGPLDVLTRAFLISKDAAGQEPVVAGAPPESSPCKRRGNEGHIEVDRRLRARGVLQSVPL
jgi:hypothetical protein